MHTFNEAAAGVPAFLAKLWRLVEDPDTNNLICWRSDGKSFIIQNQAQFARELLPLNYKHNNMASFIRQLNMYGFHKITSIDNGGLKFDKDEMEFSHPCFQKDSPFLLEHIKRKIANPKPTSTEEKGSLKPETANKMMNEVKLMRGRQDNLDSRFSAMKQENEALWREIAVLRQKHMKQQQIVNKLIQFLVTIVQPTRGSSGINNVSGVKRRFQLMINNVPESQAQASKVRKVNDDSGPVIRELTEDLFDDVNYDDEFHNSPDVLSPELHSTNTNDADDISDSVTFKVEKSDPQYDRMDPSHDIIEESIVDEPVSYIINEFEPDNDDWIEQNIIDSSPASSTSSTSSSKRKNLTISNVQSPYNHKLDQKKPNRTNLGSVLNMNQNKKPKRKNSTLRLKIDENPKGKSFDNAAVLVKNKGKQMDNVAGEASNSKNEYTNTDFLTDEIPNELFDSQEGTSSPLVSFNTSGSFNPTLTEDYSKKLKDSTNSKNLALTKYNNKLDQTLRLNTADDVNSHLDNMQTELDSIKDLFQNDDYTLDTNTLMGKNTTGGQLPKNRLLSLSPSVDNELFSKIFGDLDAPYELSLNPDFGMDKRNDGPSTSGSELMTYQPYNHSNVDLSEFLTPITTETNDGEDTTTNNDELNTPCIDKKRISFKTK